MKSQRRSLLSGCAFLPLIFAGGALAQQAVEWKVSEGGNGHWYKPTSEIEPFWTLVPLASARGGHLVTLTSQAESAFVYAIRVGITGADFALGAYQDHAHPSYSEPAGGWKWVSGEPFNWGLSGRYPDNANWFNHSGQDFLTFYGSAYLWDDFLAQSMIATWPLKSIIEWDADCNGDGIVDYGQILSGELADSNGNGVPDCCEDGSACVSSLVANASFEAGSPLAACVSESITAPNMLGSAWQVSAGTVDRVRGGTACASSTQPKFGDYAVDLCGTPASSGAIRQIVATIPGHKYRCTFWLSGDASAAPATKKVHAKVGTYIDLSYTFACSGSGAQSWVANQFEFTARGASETLEFAADNGLTTGGPMLDAINLADITTQCVGDIDGSGDVDGADISLLLLNFGPCSTTP